MTKNDLRNGDVVEYRCGDRRIISGVLMAYNNMRSYNKLSSLNDNLTSKINKNNDIVKVYRINMGSLKLELIWEIEEHTIEIDGKTINLSKESFESLKKQLIEG